MRRKEMAMLGSADVVKQLTEEGYDLNMSYLQWLMRDDIIRPPAKLGNVYAWTEPDVDRLRSELRRRDRGPAARTTGGTH